MKYLDEFRDRNLAQKLISKIKNFKKEVKIMEVCGTHTVNFFRFGLHNLIPPNVKIISGPGCPVCVTSQKDIDYAVELSNFASILTYGDMMRVPGTRSSLEKEKAKGKDIRVIYSAYDVLKIVEKEKGKNFVFFAIGFETTAPATAFLLCEMKKNNIKNLKIFCCHKLIPPAMKAICEGQIKINAFLCPGHVSTIIGETPYYEIAEKYKIPCIITGFEAIDILFGITKAIELIEKGDYIVFNAYKRAVRKKGNERALELLEEVFDKVDAEWRGLGVIPESGYSIKEEFKDFDVRNFFNFKIESYEYPGCRCGDVLKGLVEPTECPHFGKNCTPENPLGPCMVSSEGTCAAYYKFKLSL